MATGSSMSFGRTNSGNSVPPLRPKASGFVQNMVNGINRLEQRATGNRRKKFEAKQLPPGQDIFHGYEFPQAPAAPTKTAGRKPYNWTPKRSRELIKLIIHSDLKFDDISTAMKDEDGNGPSETTCRNHWHEIFGYSPDMARLKYGKGRDRRLREHVEAFEAHQKKVKLLRASTVAAELDYSSARAARSSKASSTLEQSRTSSIYADSGIQVDDEAANIKQQPNEESADPMQHQPYGSNFFVTPAAPGDQVNNAAPSFDGFGIRPGLSTVQEDSETAEYHTRPTTPSLAPGEMPPPELPHDRRPSKIPAKTVDHIEEKEELPSGFITWFRKISLGSTTESRHPSTASYASRTSLRFSHSVRNSVATSISMGYHQERVPKDAICKYLGNITALMEPSVGYVEELIQRGADVNAKNARGETPLHFAVGRGAIVICTILLQNGANAEAKSYSGESIWEFGRRISKNTLNPDGTYEKAEQLLRTMVAARIEFLRATIKFNPNMIVEEPDRIKRRRNSDQNVNAWSRSGAASSASRKKSKVHSPSVASVSPRPGRSPSTSQPTPEPPSLSTTGSRDVSSEPMPQPEVALDTTQWQYSAQPHEGTQIYPDQVNDPSYFQGQTSYQMFNNNQIEPSFSIDPADPLYNALGQEFMIDYDSNMMSNMVDGDMATIHPSQDMGYMTGDTSQQSYLQSATPVQQQFAQPSPPIEQQFAQPSPPIEQQYTQSTSPAQQYTQTSPPTLQQQYSHPSPPSLQQQSYTPPTLQHQYSVPSPPPCPEGTVSPAQLSMAASPNRLSSPSQYYSHSERGNSNASSVVDPVVVPNNAYTLGVEQGNVCLPQEYTGFSAMGNGYDQTWGTGYQQQQPQNHGQAWAQQGGGGFA